MTSIQAPPTGHLIELEESSNWEALSQLIGFDFEARLDDDAEHITGFSKAGVVISGDVHVKGSVTSTELPHGRPGFTQRETKEAKRYFVVVLGDLVVDGDLQIVQYNDLFVTGSVKAKSLRGASANLIVKRRVEVDELICYEDSEEGGVLYGASFKTPVLVRLGCNNDVEQKLEGRLLSDTDDDARSLLRGVVYDLKSVDASSSLDLYRAISALMKEGRSREFVEALSAPPTQD